jgi:molybdopterin-containing oxidoreductase family membrane subunit
MLDLVLASVYLYLTFIKDFHLLHKHSEELNAPKWKVNLWKKLSLGYKGTDNQKKRLNKALDIMASIIIPVAIVAYSLLAWLFGMNLREGWDDSIFAPYFIISAILSGLATIMILMALLNYFTPSKNILTKGHFHFIGYGMGLVSLAFGYFTFSDYITRWYNTSFETAKLIDKYLSFNEYGVMTITTMILTTIIPVVVIAVPKLRTRTMYTISAALILIGLWMFRYLLIVPVLETPYLPITSIDPATIKYSATWIEWALMMAGFGGGIIIFLLILKIVPIFPISEMEEKHEFRLFGKYNFRNLFEEKDFSTNSK